MANSDPVLRMRIASAMKERRIVKAKTVEDLKETCGLDDVSNTQFRKALSSLHYNYSPVYLSRPTPETRTSRLFRLTYMPSTPAYVEPVDGLTSEEYLYVKFVQDFMGGHSDEAIEYTDYEFDSEDMVCVSAIGSAFKLTSEHNASLRAAVRYLAETGVIAVYVEPVRARVDDRKIRPAESRVILTLL